MAEGSQICDFREAKVEATLIKCLYASLAIKFKLSLNLIATGGSELSQLNCLGRSATSRKIKMRQ